MQRGSIAYQKVLMPRSSINIDCLHCSLVHSGEEELSTSEEQAFARSAEIKRHTSAVNPCCYHTMGAQCSFAEK